MKLTHNNILTGVIIFVALVAIALASTTYIIILPRLDHTDTQGRQAAFRICQRQMINRAVINQHLDVDLPLYDCRPNLHGDPARRLTPAEARALQALVKRTPLSELP